MSKQDGGNCGCSSGGENALGGLMSGGSGYSFGASSSPMLLGPNSGYGAIDPYKVGITTGSTSALAYPPLSKFIIGGQRRKSSRRSSSKSRKTRGGKSKSKSRSSKSKSKSKSRSSKSKSKSRRLRRQGGGELSFSDFVSSPAAASSPSVGQIASSPTYGADLSPLGHKLSALANPIVPQVKNTCK